MAGFVRRTFQKLLDHELGVLGGDLDAIAETNADLGLRLAALAERFDRLQNRSGMRQARAARRAEGEIPAADREALQAAFKTEQARFDPDDPSTWH